MAGRANHPFDRKSAGQLGRFHPYGRGKRFEAGDFPPGRFTNDKNNANETPLGFIVDRVGTPFKRPADQRPVIPVVNFVPSTDTIALRRVREFTIFMHPVAALIEDKDLKKGISERLKAFGNVTHFQRNKSRTAVRIRLVNDTRSIEFDPSIHLSDPMYISGSPCVFKSAFRDVKSRLLQTEEVNYKQIEAHVVLAPSFDRQVQLIIEQAMLTSDDLAKREELRRFLEEFLNFHEYDCTTHLIGSSKTQLGLRDSDFDLFVQLKDYHLKYEPIDRNTAVLLLKEIRMRLRQEFEMFIPNVINARCPIIKIEFNRMCSISKNGLMCDLSISNILGTYNSKIVKHFLDQEPLFRQLAAIVKYWLSARGLIGPNHITSYGCLLMVMFFLQSNLILPSLYQLQFTVPPDYVENQWNVAYDTSPKFFTYQQNSGSTSSSPDLKRPNLSSLFLCFFNFYAKFPFNSRVICPHYGFSKSKSDLLNESGFNPKEFSIQDLIQLNSNVGQNMTTEFFNFFKKTLKLIDHMIINMDPKMTDDEAAKKTLTKMVESVDDQMVEEFESSKYIFQDQPKPNLLIKQMTIDVTRAVVQKWSVKAMDVVEETLRDVLQFRQYTRIDTQRDGILPTHQCIIGQFVLSIIGSDHQVWQKRNSVRRSLNVPKSTDYVEIEKMITQKIREDISDENDIEAEAYMSDNDVVVVTEHEVVSSDISLSFKLVINFSVGSQLIEIHFDPEESEEEPDAKNKFWSRECKVFLSNYLLDHLQHVYSKEYSF